MANDFKHIQRYCNFYLQLKVIILVICLHKRTMIVLVVTTTLD